MGQLKLISCARCDKGFERYVGNMRPGPQYCSAQCRQAAIKQRARDRFWDHVHKTDGCWEWTRARSTNGYGKFGRGRANRVAWELSRGPIPHGLKVCHTC